jgi:hypothetical protein
MSQSALPTLPPQKKSSPISLKETSSIILTTKVAMTAKVLTRADSWEKEEDEQVDCTVENGTPVFTSEPSRQSKSGSTKTSGPARTCPDCGAELYASVTINLYAVEVNSDGRIINYDGGPQPASEEDILELCEPDNTTIYCANNHPYSPQT